MKTHFNFSNQRIEEALAEYNKDKQSWEAERQEFIIKINNLLHSMDETKSKLQKIENEKKTFVENLKLQVARHIDDKFKEKLKI